MSAISVPCNICGSLIIARSIELPFYHPKMWNLFLIAKKDHEKLHQVKTNRLKGVKC